MTLRMSGELAAAVRAAARRSGMSMSAWLTAAAAAQLRHDLLGAALDEWERKIGGFTAEQLAEAERILGQTPDSSHDAA
jgi:hypothetical protein